MGGLPPIPDCAVKTGVPAAQNGRSAKMQRFLDKWLIIGLGLIVVLLVGSGTLDYWNTNRLNEDAASVAHTQEVLDLTSDVLRTLVDAETGERGFLITGKDEYLQPYESATKRLDGAMAALQEKTSDNPSQQERIKRLQEMSAVRHEFAERSYRHAPQECGRGTASNHAPVKARRRWTPSEC